MVDRKALGRSARLVSIVGGRYTPGRIDTVELSSVLKIIAHYMVNMFTESK